MYIFIYIYVYTVYIQIYVYNSVIICTQCAGKVAHFFINRYFIFAKIKWWLIVFSDSNYEKFAALRTIKKQLPFIEIVYAMV